MPTDGSINPSAAYAEQNNADHAPVGGRFRVTHGYQETWALTDPIRKHADPAVAASAQDVFYTGSALDQSMPPAH